MCVPAGPSPSRACTATAAVRRSTPSASSPATGGLIVHDCWKSYLTYTQCKHPRAALGYNPLVATTIALHGNAVDCLNQDNE